MNIKDRSIEITQSQELFVSRDEKVWGKKKKNEQRLRDLCGKSECTNIHLMREEGAEKKNWRNNGLKMSKSDEEQYTKLKHSQVG